MQPLAVKLPRVHRTPFSVEDILDPTKFTKRISPTGRTDQTRRGPIERAVFISYGSKRSIVHELRFQEIPPETNRWRTLQQQVEAAGRRRRLHAEGSRVPPSPRGVGSAPPLLWSSCRCWSTASRGATTCQCWSGTASLRPCASPRLR